MTAISTLPAAELAAISATPPASPISAADRDAITGKSLPAAQVTLSADALDRLRTERASRPAPAPLTETQHTERDAALMGLRQSATANTVSTTDLSHPIFSDPQTAHHAFEIAAAVAAGKPESIAEANAMLDAFQRAMSSPLTQWTDTSMAADIASQKMKLDAANDSLLEGDAHGLAQAAIDKYIGAKVEAFNTAIEAGATAMIDIARENGNAQALAQAQAHLNQVLAGGSRAQIQIRDAMTIAHAATTSAQAFDALRDVARQGGDARAVEHIDVLQQDSERFAATLARPAGGFNATA